MQYKSALLLVRAKEVRDDGSIVETGAGLRVHIGRAIARGFQVRCRAPGVKMKAIIEVSRKGSVFRAAAEQLAAARQGRRTGLRLSFESARSLFSELTPARLDLLDTLRRVGPCSVYALAKAAERNYSNVHADVSRLETLGLVERSDTGEISVPFESVEILVPLARVA